MLAPANNGSRAEAADVEWTGVGAPVTSRVPPTYPQHLRQVAVRATLDDLLELRPIVVDQVDALDVERVDLPPFAAVTLHPVRHVPLAALALDGARAHHGSFAVDALAEELEAFRLREMSNKG